MADDKSPLTRRRVLGGMATIGAAGAVGAGSWAAFSDQAQVEGTFTGGELDGTISYETSYNGGDMQDSGGQVQAYPNPDSNNVVLTVSDLKPGDFGSLVFGIEVGTNPAWVASSVSSENNTEGGQSNPESQVDDSAEGEGELADNMYLIPFYDRDVNSSFFDSTVPMSDAIGSGTVDHFVNAAGDLQPKTVSDVVTADLSSGTVEWLDQSDDEASGGGPASSLESPPSAAPDAEKGSVLLNGAQGNDDSNQQDFAPLQPGEGNRIKFGYDWAVPYEVGNVIQTDTLDVVFAFEFIQARHNKSPSDGRWDPGENASSNSSDGDNVTVGN